MSIASIVVVFVLSWWFCFFLALPFGVTRAEHPQSGHDGGAPAKARIGMKAIYATIGGVLMTVAIRYVVIADLISFQPG